MKKCAKCETVKSTSEFGWRNKSKGILKTYCIPCTQVYDRERYAADRPRKLARKKVNEKNIHDGIWEKIALYFLEHPCVECGEKDIRALEFDHLKDKEKNVSDMIRWNYAWKRIEAEIDKCQVLCVKCHRIKSFANSARARMFDKYQAHML